MNQGFCLQSKALFLYGGPVRFGGQVFGVCGQILRAVFQRAVKNVADFFRPGLETKNKISLSLPHCFHDIQCATTGPHWNSLIYWTLIRFFFFLFCYWLLIYLVRLNQNENAKGPWGTLYSHTTHSTEERGGTWTHYKLWKRLECLRSENRLHEGQPSARLSNAK